MEVSINEFIQNLIGKLDSIYKSMYSVKRVGRRDDKLHLNYADKVGTYTFGIELFQKDDSDGLGVFIRVVGSSLYKDYRVNVGFQYAVTGLLQTNKGMDSLMEEVMLFVEESILLLKDKLLVFVKQKRSYDAEVKHESGYA